MKENTKKYTQEYCEIGLTDSEAQKRLEKYGTNTFDTVKKPTLIKKLFSTITEPMFLLLIVAAVIYFLLGEAKDGTIMLVFVVGMMAIEFGQEWKTDKTLDALKELSSPKTTVVRGGVEKQISSDLIVPDDVMLLCEGMKIPADGIILKNNNLYVDESTLTGESVHVRKTSAEDNSDSAWKKNRCYAGTLVTQGTAAVVVEATGAATEYGKIGKAVSSAPDRPTPLERQSGKIVKTCGIIAAAFFVAVCVITFIRFTDASLGERATHSILAGITLAMAMIPEEFPVILTVFLSMGAWRLAKKNALVRRLSSAETLGAVSVLCVDKTGTITTNKMTVTEVSKKSDDMLCVMGNACETDAYDPMEKAIIAYCRENMTDGGDSIFSGELVKDYDFSDKTKMMGHVWQCGGTKTLAVKGCAENVIAMCDMKSDERSEALEKAAEMEKRGLRVLAVAKAYIDGECPEKLSEHTLTYCGLVGLMDPPREGMNDNINMCHSAGVRVIMITGDSASTALSIAKNVGMNVSAGAVTGNQLEKMSDDELRLAVKTVNIFARVMPSHKMRIVKALKANGEVVAMTGDGVNDAAALKYSDIGIAMGKNGSEVAGEAADMILLEDDFSVIIDTIRDGRRIYYNIRKAFGYVFAIHIPIALSALFGALMGLDGASLLLLPVHVVLAELVIDPTCSVVLERQPEELNIMSRPPRKPDEGLISKSIIIKSVLQGITIFAASFFSYLYFTKHVGVEAARSVGFGIILISNLFLVIVNCSETAYAIESVKRLFRDRVMQLVLVLTFAGIAVMIYTPIGHFLKLSPLSVDKALYMILAAAVSVIWYELVKLYKRIKP